MFWETVLDEAFIIFLLAAGVRLATPLLIAALGETFTERAGILNIGVEGLMLIGAACGFFGAFFTNSAWLGLLIGMVAAGLVSLVHGYMSITLATDQIVSGFAINLVAIGLTTFLNRGILGIRAIPPQTSKFDQFAVPGLSKIPILGPVFFEHHLLVYAGLLLVPIAYIVLFKTTLGYRIRAVGEDPRAAEAVGINVHRTRYLAVFIGGLFAGVAGVALSLGQLNLFKETMVAGRGFIAVAVVMVGRWHPVGALGAAWLFGLVDAFQLRMQALGVTNFPAELFIALPYVATIVVLLNKVSRSAAPKALDKPYLRES